MPNRGDYSGKWLFSGLILSGRTAVGFAQVCDIAQTGAQIAGLCKGPNGDCSAVGVVNGASVNLTCQVTNVNNPSLSGVLTFHGAVAPDAVIRELSFTPRRRNKRTSLDDALVRRDRAPNL